MDSARRWVAVVGIAVALPLTGCIASRYDAPLPTGSDPVQLDPSDFTTNIDNAYWPMKPGTQWTYRETDPKGDLKVVVTVTSDTKKVADGIEARVVRDSVWRGDQLVEDTFDWYAQDRDGAIWYLGEDTAEFENGQIASREGSFESGVDGALPGIALPADPKPGMRYRQEYYAGQAEDEGAVLGIDELVQVPYGAYTGALLTRDTSPIEPDVEELKFYAKGVGPVLTVAVSGENGREELLSITTVPDGTGTGPLGSPE
ncbi:hypothetical protein ACH3VR_04435 [Microbacterium sp. B2969]|uniref:Lipoprotein n=1 Tax=Microbacterium alkaliflavum TaxID=3248839 RepID=A0ABW7Q7N4_9MICO